MNISIGPAQEADIPRMLEILKTVNMHNVPSPEMPELDWKCYFVARAGGKVVGFAGYKVLSPGDAKTTLMAVDPEYRRYGIGRALQERRMLVLSEMGIRTLTTNADIPDTIRWYKKNFGYEEIGTLRKLHEFSLAEVDEWTTLRTDLTAWRVNYERDRDKK